MYYRSSLPYATNHCCRCLSDMHWLLWSSRKTVLTRRMFKTIVRFRTSHTSPSLWKEWCANNSQGSSMNLDSCQSCNLDFEHDIRPKRRRWGSSLMSWLQPIDEGWPFWGCLICRRCSTPSTTPFSYNGLRFRLDCPELCFRGWRHSSMVVGNRWSSMARLHQWKESLPAFLKEVSLAAPFSALHCGCSVDRLRVWTRSTLLRGWRSTVSVRECRVFGNVGIGGRRACTCFHQ